MTQHDFCMWLNGYIELGGGRPDEDQWEMIKEHLALVFTKTTRDLLEIKSERARDAIDKFNDRQSPVFTLPEIGPQAPKPNMPWQIPDLPAQAPFFDPSKLVVTC